MADEKPAPVNHWEPLLFILALFIIGGYIIWQRGGLDALKNSGGLFVSPPQIAPTPVDVPLTQVVQPTDGQETASTTTTQ